MEPLTDYVLDTMALVKHLEDALPPAANRAFRDAEGGGGRLFLPEIALAEFAYVARRGWLRVDNPRAVLEEVVDQIRAADYLALSSLPAPAWDIFLDLRIPELHDRMIASDALHRRLPLITNDRSMKAIEGLRTLWR